MPKPAATAQARAKYTGIEEANDGAFGGRGVASAAFLVLPATLYLCRSLEFEVIVAGVCRWRVTRGLGALRGDDLGGCGGL